LLADAQVLGRTISGFAAAVAAAQASASSSISSSADSDPYGTGSVGESGSASAGGAGSGGPAGSNQSTVASETESHRIMSAVLREWRRMPLITTSQHVPLLQIAHRAVEITEGNSLLAQYCGHVLCGPCLGPSMTGSAYTSPGQSSSGSSTPGVASASGTGGSSSAASSAALRMPLSQALHDYKTVFKWWQSRPPSIGDDLGFWHDLFSWRQVVEESIITCHPYLQKFGPERTKQEIKLKLAELRKDELLEGLELMEKTNIQQYEKKDRAKFFCYKAVFFSHFNKGDEATKNFGYATQMQDNIHKVWSIYGDFLENVYSSYPVAKREVAVSTTGIFAMQALMEAASVAGGQERRSRADLSKCIWLLTLDDDTKGHQRLARTFEERASRVRPDAFLPWLPSLVASLLRPEGRFIVPALRGVTATHPTVLYSLLRGLQHQLSTEMLYDERLGELAHMTVSEPTGSFPHLLQARIHASRGSRSEDAERKQTRLPSGTGGELGHSSTGLMNLPTRGSTLGAGELPQSSSSTGPTGSTGSIAVSGNISGSGSSGGGLTSYSAVSQLSSKKKKRVIVVMRGVEGERLSGGSPLSPEMQQQQQSVPSQQQAKKGSRELGDPSCEEDETIESKSSAPKKAVVVVAPNADSGATSSSGRDSHSRTGMTSDNSRLDDTEDMDGCEEDEDEDTEDGEFDRDEVSGTGVSGPGGNVCGSPGSSLPTDSGTAVGSVTHDTDGVGTDQGTGCLSSSVTDGLYRVNLLIGQIRRRHAARIYAVDLFTTEVGGRLQPTWAEQLLTRLCSVLDYLQRLAWAGVSSGRHWHPRSVERIRIPGWLLLELRIQLSTACGLSARTPSVNRSGWARLCELAHGPDFGELKKRASVSDTRKRDTSSSSSSESDKEEPRKPARAGRKQQLGGDSGKTKLESAATDTGSKLPREKQGVSTPSAKRSFQSETKRPVLRPSLRLTPAFSEVTQIAAEGARREADRDPWFMRVHRQLLKAVDDWENRSVLYVMQRLTRHWIPLLEQQVARLPSRMHLSDYGARRLMELPSLIVAPNHVSVGPSSTGGTASSVTSSVPPGTNILLPSIPCLELPGESGLLQSTGGFLNSSAFPYPAAQGPLAASVGPNLALHLVIAEVFPQVARIRSSPSHLGCPARRLGIRASNGRVFYYDLPALGYWPPINSSTYPALASAMSIQINAAAGARTHSLIHAKPRGSNIGPLTLDGLSPAPYTGWRHAGPLHLFQMINDVLAGQPETAKRRLSLFTPSPLLY
uniref:FAT domain-containing protein n=1 Tax=Echinostoma caproni TaxID=27848 RepID=A0A183APY7_9TREM